MSFAPLDLDECDSGEACCAQLCINYSGGYECSCQEGFQISSDGCGCDGKFLSFQHEIPDVMGQSMEEEYLRQRVRVRKKLSP